MPKHTQVITIEITPERFLENCSDDELKELDLLIQSERYQSRIREKEIGFKQINKKDENELVLFWKAWSKFLLKEKDVKQPVFKKDFVDVWLEFFENFQ